MLMGVSVCGSAEGLWHTCRRLWVDVAALQRMFCSQVHSLWLQLSMLLTTDPVTSPGASSLPSIQPHHLLVSGPPSGSKKSCELLSYSPWPHANLTLTCHCHFSHLAPRPSSFILLALLSLHLAGLSSMSPLMEDSLPDSSSVSNIISPCNLSLARRGVTWHNALVDGVNFWHLFYSTGKDLNRNLSAGPGFFLLQQLSTWQKQLQYFFLPVLLFIVFSIVQIPQ